MSGVGRKARKDALQGNRQERIPAGPDEDGFNKGRYALGERARN